MIEVEVDSIRVSLTNQQRVVLLKDMTAERFLPIWIGQPEAEAITIELQEVEQPRPLTHDLLKNTIEALGGKIDYVLINDLRRDIFYAKIVVTINDEKVEVDSRSSDAIAVAVRAKCAIFVNESVMERAAVEPEDDVELDEVENEVAALLGNDSEEQDEVVDDSKLSAFADFVNSLDLDELDDDDKKK